MKRKLLVILVAILGFLSLNLNVQADSAPSTFTSGTVKLLEQYYSGIKVYYKTTTAGTEVFCEDESLKLYSGYTYKYNSKVDDGYIYILEHRPNTGSTYKNYYIQSLAVWWYKDYLNGTNSNLTQKQKDYMYSYRNSEGSLSKAVYDLVDGAKNYKQTAGTISFSSGNVTFTEYPDYYLSNSITVTSSGTNKFNGVTLSNAPSGTTIVNSSVDNNGNGSFQIKVPKSSMVKGTTYNFTVNASGTYAKKSAYDYYYGSGWQKLIYGKVFSEDINVSGSKSVSIKRGEGKLIIQKLDENGNYVSGAGLTIYNGNCVESTCTDVYTTWTSGNSAKEFTNVPIGTYTLVETKTPDGYQTANKMLIIIRFDSENTTYKMVDKKAHNQISIQKVDGNDKGLDGAELTLYKGDCTNSTCTDKYMTWTTTTSSKVFNDIPVGKYTLVETKTPTGYQTAAKQLINIDSNNKIYPVIKMIDQKEIYVRISKTDITGEVEVPGATLVLKDENGKQVEKWVSTTNPHYVVLEPGIYELTETIAPKGYVLSKSTITFKVDANNNVYEKNAAGVFVKVDYVKMVNVSKEAINISKLDSDTNEYVSGADLIIKNNKGEVVANWTTGKESHYVSLEEGEYVLSEKTAPNGYELNSDSIYFKVDADGNLYIKGANGEYNAANGIIMYNKAEEIEVPATGLSSMLTYVIGTLVIGFGATMLYRNEKKC